MLRSPAIPARPPGETAQPGSSDARSNRNPPAETQDRPGASRSDDRPSRKSPGHVRRRGGARRPPQPGLRPAGFAKRPGEIVDRGDYRRARSLFCSQYWYLPQAFAAPRSGRLDRYRSFCPSSVKSMRLPRCRGESIADDATLS